MPVVAGPPQGHGPSTFDKSELLRTSLNIARSDQPRGKQEERNRAYGITWFAYGLADLFCSENGCHDGVKYVRL